MIEACDTLNKRLAPLRALMKSEGSEKNVTWQQLITKAYNVGVDLKASAWTYWNGAQPFIYNSYGVACTEGKSLADLGLSILN